jgi:hypothetical protein
MANIKKKKFNQIGTTPVQSMEERAIKNIYRLM